MRQNDLHPLEILRALGIEGTPAVTPASGRFDMAMWKVEMDGQAYPNWPGASAINARAEARMTCPSSTPGPGPLSSATWPRATQIVRKHWFPRAAGLTEGSDDPGLQKEVERDATDENKAFPEKERFCIEP